MDYGCFLPRAGYAAFFERKILEKHLPGGDLLQRLADHGHPKTRRDKRERASGPVRFLNDSLEQKTVEQDGLAVSLKPTRRQTFKSQSP